MNAHYTRFSRALEEVIDARVWGGIHFRTADTQGAVIGKEVARWERKHFFQPTRRHSHDPHESRAGRWSTPVR